MRLHIAILTLLASILSFTAEASSSATAPARNLAHRILGEKAARFEFREIPPSSDPRSPDRFTIASADSIIIIGGNNPNSMAVGLNYYLKNYAGVAVSWYNHDPQYIPRTLPAVPEPIEGSAIVPHRFFLNYCTFGYTMPWWKWADWEHLIDWMALNGINMPLAITGQEAVWYNVWHKMGLSDTEIRSYFTGPAHLPWHRMSNIDGWQGPLPMEWISSQAELQAKIVARERELGMTPVLPAFAGHVPAILKKYQPSARIHNVGDWNRFDSTYHCSFLYANDPLFSRIQRMYLDEQNRLYGTDHIYGIDCFNEVAPPSWHPDSLASISRSVIQSLTEIDPKAVWLQMTWLFYYDKNWTPERIKAYLSGVEPGRLLLLDYFCDNTPLWEKTESFHGHDYIWCFLGNFGGTTFLIGNPRQTSSRIEKCRDHGGSNFSGLGSTLEGFDVNPYLHEFVFDKAWQTPLSDADRFRAIATSRTGSSPSAAQAWQLLIDSIYTKRTGVGHATLNNSRPCLTGIGCNYVKNKTSYPNATLARAWQLLIDAADSADNRDTYRFDLVNVGRQVLGNHFTTLRDNFNNAYLAADTAALRRIGSDMLTLIDDITSLLACHTSFTMRPWLQGARSMTANPDSAAYYEQNARTLITYWGGDRLFDYANRAYAELNHNFYRQRWAIFIDSVIDAARRSTTFNQQEFNLRISEFEHQWTDPTLHPVTFIPMADPLITSRRLLEKYREALL